jgi:hypothetical protein
LELKNPGSSWCATYSNKMLRAKQEQLPQNPELEGNLRRAACLETVPANRCREVLLLESSARGAQL